MEIYPSLELAVETVISIEQPYLEPWALYRVLIYMTLQLIRLKTKKKEKFLTT